MPRRRSGRDLPSHPPRPGVTVPSTTRPGRTVHSDRKAGSGQAGRADDPRRPHEPSTDTEPTTSGATRPASTCRTEPSRPRCRWPVSRMRRRRILFRGATEAGETGHRVTSAQGPRPPRPRGVRCRWSEARPRCSDRDPGRPREPFPVRRRVVVRGATVPAAVGRWVTPAPGVRLLCPCGIRCRWKAHGQSSRCWDRDTGRLPDPCPIRQRVAIRCAASARGPRPPRSRGIRCRWSTPTWRVMRAGRPRGSDWEPGRSREWFAVRQGMPVRDVMVVGVIGCRVTPAPAVRGATVLGVIGRCVAPLRSVRPCHRPCSRAGRVMSGASPHGPGRGAGCPREPFPARCRAVEPVGRVTGTRMAGLPGPRRPAASPACPARGRTRRPAGPPPRPDSRCGIPSTPRRGTGSAPRSRSSTSRPTCG